MADVLLRLPILLTARKALFTKFLAQFPYELIKISAFACCFAHFSRLQTMYATALSLSILIILIYQFVKNKTYPI